MSRCDQVRGDITLYIDHELLGRESLEIEAHLTECASCRRIYQEACATIDAVRAASPLYEVPQRSYASIKRMVKKEEQGIFRSAWMPLTALATLVLGVVIGWWFSPWQAKKVSAPAQYSSFAAEAHRLYARGAFPLDIVSRQPQEVSDWLRARLPFHVRLPEYPSRGWQKKRYTLVGARLVQYLDQDVAYLAYEMDREPISVLISQARLLTPSVGETYRSGGVTFHFSEENGLRMITWTDHGLTYAQVSTVGLSGADSCGVCHGSREDRHKVENLRPSR